MRGKKIYLKNGNKLKRRPLYYQVKRMNDKISGDDKIKYAYSSSRGKGFEELYSFYYADVYYFLLNMSADSELAMDLTHDVFIKAYNQAGIEDFKIKAWLFKVAANCFFEYKRSYYRRVKYYINNIYKLIDPPEDAEIRFIEQANEACNKTRLRESLKKLDEKDRLVITLRYYNGFSYEEIAESAGMEAGTVMSRLHRAKERLKEVMSDGSGQ